VGVGWHRLSCNVARLDVQWTNVYK
jgi:hypothetical protein